MMARFDNVCMPKCAFGKCVDDLNSVIVVGTVHQVKEYMQLHCSSALYRYDSLGRTPLHFAASCGKTDTLKWLLHCYANSKHLGDVSVNGQDKESGWTPLHRAVYYGRIPCVMELLQNGANMWIKDKDGCNVFDIMIKDIAPWIHEPTLNRYSSAIIQSWNDLSKANPSELYTWGSNENMTLAQTHQKSRKLPEIVKFFARKRIVIKQVIMCKFHAVFLTQDGIVYSCGNGRGGRLGTGQEDVFIDPQMIEFSDALVTDIAAAADHTVFVTEEGQLLVCGMNHFHVLGIVPPPPKSLYPTRVSSLRDQKIIGCSAGCCHTAAWSSTALFTFGTNAGQLGHAKGDIHITQPRQVSAVYKENDKIHCVHSSDAAIVIATVQGSVFILQNYVVRKILSKHMDIAKVQVGGGSLDSTVLSQVKFNVSSAKFTKNADDKQEQKSCKVFVLKTSGDLISWSSSHCTLDRCQFDSKQLRWISDVALSKAGNVALLASVDGTAYLGYHQSWQPGKTQKKNLTIQKQEFCNSLDLSLSDSIQKFHVEQVAGAFRTHSCFIGPKGRNSAISQSDPRNFITQVPVISESCSAEHFMLLLKSVSETDQLHDVVLNVRRDDKVDVRFPCHKFILASRSQLFSKLFLTAETPQQNAHSDIAQQASANRCEVIVENIYPKIMSNVLQLIYTGSCEMLNTGSNTTDMFVGLGAPIVYLRSDVSSMHREIERKKPSKKTGKPTSIPKINCMTLLQTVAFRFGVEDAKQIFQSVSMMDGRVVSSANRALPRLSRNLNPLLFDCTIKCDDEVVTEAHRCVLSARIPYFHGMLLSPWMETTESPTGGCAQLKVPLPSDVFRYVLDFAYTDSETSLHGLSAIESYCEILAAADLLLMDRLKQVIEAQIVPLLTLKNVVLVCEVAAAFNAGQLYASCLQFTCHNLPSLLLTPVFHSADDEMLEKLEEVYRSNIKDVYRRVITPSPSAPNLDHIPLVTDDEAEETNLPKQSTRTVSPRRRKPNVSAALLSRKQKLAAKRGGGVMLSDLLKNIPKNDEDEIVERLITDSAGDESRRVAPTPDDSVARVVAAEEPPNFAVSKNTSKATVEKSNIKNSASWSSKANVSGVSLKTPLQSNTIYVDQFPSLGDDRTFSSKSKATSSPSLAAGDMLGQSGSMIITKSRKLSQKERRRLREEAEKAHESASNGKVKSPVEIPNAWGVANRAPPATSALWDTAAVPASPPSPIKSPVDSSLPSNSPWQRLPITATSPKPVHSATKQLKQDDVLLSPSFIDIVESERKSHERSERTSKKPLALIQLEDEAMDELKKYYEKSWRNAQNDRRFVTVSRLSDEQAMKIAAERKARYPAPRKEP